MPLRTRKESHVGRDVEVLSPETLAFMTYMLPGGHSRNKRPKRYCFGSENSHVPKLQVAWKTGPWPRKSISQVLGACNGGLG